MEECLKLLPDREVQMSSKVKGLKIRPKYVHNKLSVEVALKKVLCFSHFQAFPYLRWRFIKSM